MKKNTERTSRDEQVEEKRPTRVSVAKQRDKLNVKGQDPGRHYHWINDNNDGARILSLKEAGYRIETDKTLKIGDRKAVNSEGEGSSIKKYAGTDREGRVIHAYLMSIPMDFYKEDQEEKQKGIDVIEKGYEDAGDYGSIQLS